MEFLKKIWRNYILAPIRERKRKKQLVVETRVSYGRKHPDKTFFVIRRNGPTVGLFSFVCTNMGWMKYALDNGYIPVMDMQSLPNVYLEDKQVGKVNAWEFFYEQPCGYTLNDIKHAKNVILSDGGAPADFPMIEMYKNGNYGMWYDLYQKYVRIVPDIAEEIREKAEALKSAHKAVLGVNVRGTDYTEIRPTGHPIQPTMDEAISVTRQKIDEWGCDAIYLATEDESIVERFSAEFGDMIILPEGVRYDYRKEHLKYVTQNGYDRENDRYLRGREYLVKIGILANLDYIVSSYMGSTYGMSLMNREYKGEFYWDLGFYE